MLAYAAGANTHIQTMPIPVAQPHYGAEYIRDKGWDHFSFGQCSPADAAAIAAEFAHIHSGEPALEIGFGNGAVLAYLAGRGVRCVGVELNEGLVAAARNHGFEAFQSLDPLLAQERKFQTIIAMDVIEHVPKSELASYFRQLAALLRNDGHLYLRFPNGDSPFGRIAQYSDLTHETVLGRGRLQMLASAAGLTIRELRAPRTPLRGLGFVRMLKRAGVLSVRRASAKFISTFFLGGVPVPLDPNYFAVLSLAEPAASQLRTPAVA